MFWDSFALRLILTQSKRGREGTFALLLPGKYIVKTLYNQLFLVQAAIFTGCFAL